MIRTKDSCTRQYGIGLGRARQGAEPRQISERLTFVPSQAQERGRQRFVQERALQATERRVKGRNADNITPTRQILLYGAVFSVLSQAKLSQIC